MNNSPLFTSVRPARRNKSLLQIIVVPPMRDLKGYREADLRLPSIPEPVHSHS